MACLAIEGSSPCSRRSATAPAGSRLALSAAMRTPPSTTIAARSGSVATKPPSAIPSPMTLAITPPNSRNSRRIAGRPTLPDRSAPASAARIRAFRRPIRWNITSMIARRRSRGGAAPAGDRRDFRLEQIEGQVNGLAEERLLGAEVPIHRRLGDVGDAGDVVHLHGLVGRAG